jgi:hypothetical protein
MSYYRWMRTFRLGKNGLGGLCKLETWAEFVRTFSNWLNLRKVTDRNLFAVIFSYRGQPKFPGNSGPRMPDVMEKAGEKKQLDTDTRSDARTPNLDPLHFCEALNNSNNICNTQWVQLYSTAAYFPIEPSEEDREAYKNYFENFIDQCTDSKVGGCIDRAMKLFPPRKDFDRNEMMLWLCNLETICRRDAGLPLPQCRASKLQKRWGYSDGYL